MPSLTFFDWKHREFSQLCVRCPATQEDSAGAWVVKKTIGEKTWATFFTWGFHMIRLER
jgi:hypothetical protein